MSPECSHVWRVEYRGTYTGSRSRPTVTVYFCERCLEHKHRLTGDEYEGGESPLRNGVPEGRWLEGVTYVAG